MSEMAAASYTDEELNEFLNTLVEQEDARQQEPTPDVSPSPDPKNTNVQSEIAQRQSRALSSTLERLDSIQAEHLRKILSHSLLEPHEEVELGKRIQNGQAVQAKLGQATDNNEVVQLKDQKTVNDGLAAKELLISHNYRYAMKRALSYYHGHPKGKEFGLIDLFNEATFGLLRAAEKFDPDKGFKFCTYADSWIRQSMQRAVQNKGAAIRLPTHMDTRARKISKLHAQGMSYETIAQEHGIASEDIRLLTEYEDRMWFPDSLDRQVGDMGDRGSTLGELTPAPDPIEAGDTELNEFQDKKLERLEEFLDEKYIAALRSTMQGEPLNETQKKHMYYFRGVMLQPAVSHAIAEVFGKDPQALFDEDWKGEANCIGSPELYTAKESAVQKDKIAAICGECAVRDACEAYFETRKPVRGRFVDGIVHKEKPRKKPTSKPKPSAQE
jgi:DNA-directed RNA polymerase sigma subunit (sigma70/sigma32)